jgi:Fe2+ transport system protein FeoA
LEALLSIPAHKKVVFISCSLPALCSRLADVGMIPGSTWEVMGKIPFSGPLIVGNGSIRISIRPEDAAKISVEAA